MSTYKRPFVRQEPQRQRQRLNNIVKQLRYAREDKLCPSWIVSRIDMAIDSLEREKDRLLPPVKDGAK